MTATLQSLRPTHGKDLKKNRWPGIIFVIGIHVAVIWALANGLANATITLLRGNLQTVQLQEELKNDLPPPPPPPDFKPPPVVAIAPEVSIDLAQAPVRDTTAISPPPPPKPTAPVAVAPPPPPAPPTPAVIVAEPKLSAEDYPPVSLRLQEQGIVTIKYIIGTAGSVTECSVEKQSGKVRLDDAACAYVKKRFKYKPATQDGKPVASQKTVQVVFQLH